jgi:CDP-paratose 2-epimerase
MKILVTGGAGFIGSNVANHFAGKGHDVTIYDNLSRPGVMANLKWLLENHRNIEVIEDDIEIKDLTYALRDKDVVFHFAAQVGVQESIANPRHDFNVNTLGTFNLLEYARKQEKPPFIIFASTNKVYGDIDNKDPISERQTLSFCTPYGCSKGAAEQYVLDYYRVFKVPTVVLRMSCIYGDRQFGTEEQGWLCHFARAKFKEEPITIYGDGTQRRDILHIDDYVHLMEMLIENKDNVKGQVFNIGGGPDNHINIGTAAQLIGVKDISYKDWRPSDQHTYISNISKIEKTIAWKPTIGVSEGLERIQEWAKQI